MDNGEGSLTLPLFHNYTLMLKYLSVCVCLFVCVGVCVCSSLHHWFILPKTKVGSEALLSCMGIDVVDDATNI